MAHKLSILGLNARNLRFQGFYNRRPAVRIADDKLLTKRILDRHGLPTQKLFDVITRARDLAKLRWQRLPASFVIKPNRGFGGSGIIVIRGRKKSAKGEERTFISVDQQEWTVSRLEEHITDILDGRFSLTNSPDMAFVEERIRLHPMFTKITFRGVPDIRIIVFNKVPIMAMVRLPTALSHGKANIVQGAVAVGLDIADGTAINAAVKKPRRHMLEKHPDTGENLLNIKIPEWDKR